MRARSFEIEISQDLHTIEADWRALESNGVMTPFQTSAWLTPLYRVLAPEMRATPLFVFVRETCHGRPVLLLPLCVRRHYGVPFVEFADFGVCDYNAPILSRDIEFAQEDWRGLWDEIVGRLKSFGPLMRLQKLPPLIDGRINPLTYDARASAMNVGSWGVELPGSIDLYEQNNLNSTFRKELAKKVRRVLKRGEAEWVTATSAQARSEVFGILARQRQARCDEMGRHNVLSEPAFRRFYDAATGDPSVSSLVRLNALKVGEEIVASMLSLRHHNASYVIMTTFEGGEWKSASLGNVLIRQGIERSIEDGVRYFDLTIGDEGYKRDFGATRQPLRAILRPLSPAGVGIAAAVRAATRFRDRRIS